MTEKNIRGLVYNASYFIRVFSIFFLLGGCGEDKASQEQTATSTATATSTETTGGTSGQETAQTESTSTVTESFTGTDTSTDTSTETSTDSSTSTIDPFSDCTGKSLSFTHDIVDSSNHGNLSYTNGIGTVAPPSHTIPVGHTYLSINDQDLRMPIYLPTDARLYSLGKQDKGGGAYNIGIWFQICGDITFSFGHLNELSDEIATLTSCTGSTCAFSGENLENPIEFEAGTLIGYKGGEHKDGAGLDFGVVDATQDVPFEIPGGVSVWGNYVYSACPYDYFADSSVRSYYAGLLANGIQVGPSCGTLSYDVDGTLQGYWFDEDTVRSPGPNEGNHLVIAPTNSNASREFMATGSFVSHGAYYEYSTSGQINRKSSQITADGNTYCFDALYSHHLTTDTLPGYIMMKMTDSSTLQVEYTSSGDCPADPNTFVFTGSSLEFIR